MRCGWERRESIIGGHYYHHDDGGELMQVYHNNRGVTAPGSGWWGWIYGVGDIGGLHKTHYDAIHAVEQRLAAMGEG